VEANNQIRMQKRGCCVVQQLTAGYYCVVQQINTNTVG